MSDAGQIPSTFETQSAGTQPLPFFVRQIEHLLRNAKCGSITVVLPNGHRLLHETPNSGPHAKVVIRKWRTLWRLMTDGELGFAKAYIQGDWWTPDLAAFLEFGARNDKAMSGSLASTGALRMLGRIQHWARQNTKRGSRRNIAAHYDLGNAFYGQWLDRGMNYSSALYSHPDQSLDAAQETKLDRAIALLDLSGGERVLEIGCGWGSLLERLIRKCHVTGLTLSTEQLDYARRRLGGVDGATHAELRLQDYRDAGGTYDRVVSIEMIEAVGETYWPAYFCKLRQLLTSGGTAVLQAITINEDRFAAYRGQPDFIQRYIFPGGMLPTVEAIARQASRAGLELVACENFGQSYALTLAEWRRRFLASWPAIQQLGFDLPFKRMWEYYLCYCEVGFRNGAIDVGFYKLAAR